MRYFFLYLLFIAPIVTHGQLQTISSSGIDRSFVLQLPNQYDAAEEMPLILVLHGYGDSTSAMQYYSGFQNFVDRDVIVAYPHGLRENGSSGNYFWNIDVPFLPSQVDDVKYIDELIANLKENYAVDSDKVYIVGHSNGGMMAYLLAQKSSHKIAAMANLAGTMQHDNFIPEHTVPLLHIHGTNDETVPVTGSFNPFWPMPAISGVLDKWAIWNKTTSGPQIVVDSDLSEEIVWKNTAGENMVTAAYIKGQGHEWPDITNSGWNIHENIWSFFTTGNLLSQVDPQISIIGPAVAGWNKDVLLETTDGVIYTLKARNFNSGVLKFRQGFSWTKNWGSASFPTGVGVLNGDDIPVPKGTFSLLFNLSDSSYTFTPEEVVVSYPKISIIGAGAQGWNVDVPMSTSNGIDYVLEEYEFKGGDVKFRQDSDWDTNWGSVDFPNGTGVKDGENITVENGIYTVSFNLETGQYAFILSPTLSSFEEEKNLELINNVAIETIYLFPNPVENELTIQSKSLILSVKVYTETGQLIVYTTTNKIDFSDFPNGVYFVAVQTPEGRVVKKIIK